MAERVCKGTHQVRGKREILRYGKGPGSILAAIERGCDARGSVAGDYHITIKPYCILRRALQLGGTGSDESGRGGVVVDLGNERDVADYVLRAHGRP